MDSAKEKTAAGTVPHCQPLSNDAYKKTCLVSKFVYSLKFCNYVYCFMTLNKYSASYIINYVLDTYWFWNSVLLPGILTSSSFTLLSTKGCKNNIFKSATFAVSQILTSPPYTANFHVIRRHLVCVEFVEIKTLNKIQITQNRFCFHSELR